MFLYIDPKITQIVQDLEDPTERVFMKDLPKTMFEIWEGQNVENGSDGMTPEQLFNRVRLTRETRQYMNVRTHNIFRNGAERYNYQKCTHGFYKTKYDK